MGRVKNIGLAHDYAVYPLRESPEGEKEGI
jgi:hypothetical protein